MKKETAVTAIAELEKMIQNDRVIQISEFMGFEVTVFKPGHAGEHSHYNAETLVGAIHKAARGGQ